MSTFQEYMEDVLSVYDSSWKKWTQETMSKTSLFSASYDKQHAMHVGMDRPLTAEEMRIPNACENFATEVRLCISKDALEGNTDDPVIRRIGEAAKRAIESGVAQDVSVVAANFRVVVARR